MLTATDHISKYVTYGEAIHSDTAERLGILNVPDANQLANMQYVASRVFDKVRDHFGVPIIVSSFFRSPALNAAVPGSSKTSQHMNGEAIDHLLPGRNAEIFKWAKANIDLLDFDQMIWEYGTSSEPAWVHISKVSYRPNRHQILRYYTNAQGQIVGIPFDLF
jgi:zinc D-Ala-D-Ala carboxypeptidase